MAKRKKKTRAEAHGIVKHPNVFGKEMVERPKLKKRAVGLDFGNLCGYAFFEYLPTDIPCEVVPVMGVWNLTPGDWDTGATRLVRLRQFLNVLVPDIIFYEDARYESPADLMKGKAVGQIIARAISGSRPLIALHATTVVWADEHNIPTHPLTSGEIKKHATGKGVAKKEDMVAAANKKWGLEIDLATQKGMDNAVDASFALDLGMDLYMEGLQ